MNRACFFHIILYYAPRQKFTFISKKQKGRSPDGFLSFFTQTPKQQKRVARRCVSCAQNRKENFHRKKIVRLSLVVVTLMAVATPALALTGRYIGGDSSSYNIRRGHEGAQVKETVLLQQLPVGALPDNLTAVQYHGRQSLIQSAFFAPLGLRFIPPGTGCPHTGQPPRQTAEFPGERKQHACRDSDRVPFPAGRRSGCAATIAGQ